MNKPIKNYGDVITMKVSTAGSLVTHQYGFVKETTIGQVAKAGVAENVVGVNTNVYVLLNAPAVGEEAQCGVLGTGQFRVKIATGAVSLGTTISISTGGFAKVSTGLRIFGRLDEAATAANDVVVVNTQIND